MLPVDVALTSAILNDQVLGDCREKLCRDGYFYLETLPDGVDYEAFIEHFGVICPQYGHKRIWDLKPEPGMDDVYHSNNTQPLVPHTECYEYPGIPPRYLALWCIRPARTQGGATLLSDGYGLLQELSEREREQLMRQTYRFTSSAGLKRRGISLTAEHPLLELRADGEPIIRFSSNHIAADERDPLIGRFRERVNQYFRAHHVSVKLERNALLVWDNHRMIHSRTGFADKHRHLRRALLSEADAQWREGG
jgi:alpha-ketoglutarate-dependent taurine dioxygenase